MSNFYLWGTGVLLSTIALFTTPSTGNPGTTENVTPGDYSTTAAILNHTSKNRSAFIDAISKAEGTSGEDGYYKNFGGEIIRNVGKEHPEKCVQFFNRQTGRTDCSTAFGKGQFLNKTWKRVVKEFPDDINDISNPDHQRKAFFAVIWTEGKDPETPSK
jgi:muramidase (phage lysozyme)